MFDLKTIFSRNKLPFKFTTNPPLRIKKHLSKEKQKFINLMKKEMTMKRALITGITGQDGSYLAEALIMKGYEVHGIVRRNSSVNTWRIDDLISNSEIYQKKLFLHHGDLSDLSNVLETMRSVNPDEVYNLAAQSHVKVSFEIPIVTAETDAIGTLKILEALRILNLGKNTKFYQASTSELYGNAQEIPQTEKTPFYPRSPYGVAKLYSFWIVKNYREAYDLFACNGILFNHESERRGLTFVTRKITMGLSKIKLGLDENPLELGNIDTKRDWGYAPEYIDAMWRTLQQPKPDDYVVATGETHTVREFIGEAAKHLDFELIWEGEGPQERGIDKKTDKVLVTINPRYFRPSEVDILLGDASKAREVLGWKPKTKFESLVKKMVSADLKKLRDREVIY